MTIVTLASLSIVDGFARLAAIPEPFFLDQILTQGIVAGDPAWVGFVYAARNLGLITASFMPTITPAVAPLIVTPVTRENPTALQWMLNVLGTVCAGLLMASLHAKRTEASRWI